jgi:hypothetical protein
MGKARAHFNIRICPCAADAGYGETLPTKYANPEIRRLRRKPRKPCAVGEREGELKACGSPVSSSIDGAAALDGHPHQDSVVVIAYAAIGS